MRDRTARNNSYNNNMCLLVLWNLYQNGKPHCSHRTMVRIIIFIRF